MNINHKICHNFIKRCFATTANRNPNVKKKTDALGRAARGRRRSPRPDRRGAKANRDRHTLTPGALPPDSADRWTVRKCGGAPPAAPAGFSAFARRGRARLLQLAAAARVRAEGLSRDTDTYEPNSFKGTLHYPKPTPSENPRRNNSKNALKNSLNPHILGVSMKGA